MKKCKRKHCVRAQPDTAQLNAQHNKLHIHENDHRFLFDHGLWMDFFYALTDRNPWKTFLKIIGSLRLRNKTRRRIRETNYHNLP
jgi:hypothetical protein